MNVKQFKRRWLNSKVEPELFYLPVKKEETDEAFIFEIELKDAAVNRRSTFFICTHDNPQVRFFIPEPSDVPNWIAKTSINKTLYNLRDKEGNKISAETRPLLFWDLPFNSDYEGLPHTQLSENMVEHGINPYLNISWGDGQTSNIHSIVNKITIINEDGENEDLYFDTIDPIMDFSNPDYIGFRIQSSHSYEKKGRYIISIKGCCDSCYLPDTKNADNSYYNLCKIIQWGELNRKSFNYLFSAVITNNILFPKKLPSSKKVVTASHMFYNSTSLSEMTVKLDWDILGKMVDEENFFNAFPNVVDISDMFFKTNIPCIPERCFSKNKFLQFAYQAFWGTNLQYIGSYAFADLKYLLSVGNMCYAKLYDGLSIDESYSRLLSLGYTVHEYIGDSIFENDINLLDVGICFNSNSNDGGRYPSWRKIGNRIFANCKKITEAARVFGYDNVLLEEVGNEIFLNCENLKDVNMLFHTSPNLKKVGNDMFKGCKSLENVFDLFYYTFRLRKIPGNLFYDVEFHNAKFNMNCAFEHFMPLNLNEYYDVEIPIEKRLNRFWGQVIYSNVDVITNTMKIFNPALYQEFYNYSKELITEEKIQDELYFEFGKNMFNEKFLSQILGTEYDEITVIGGMNFNCYCYAFEDDDLQSINLIYTYYQPNRGEAPPFWRYTENPKDHGLFGYGNVNKTYHGNYGYSTTYICYNNYDNYEEIPKPKSFNDYQGWLYPTGFYDNPC